MLRIRSLSIGAAIALVLTTSSAGAALADAAPEPDGGVVEIPYGEPGELHVGDGWVISCDELPTLDDVALTCEGATLTLTPSAFDAAWGEHVLAVPLHSGPLRTTVRYRVVQSAPPAPEITTPRVGTPFPVGSQALVPLSGLGIVCTLCAEGEATVRVGEVTPATAFAGVTGTHLAVRSTEPGDVVVSVELEDAAGQTASADVTVSFSGLAAEPVALHVVVPPAAEVDLTALAWGDGLRFDCPASGALRVSCSADGRATTTDAAPGAQFAFRAVTPTGRQAVGSVTFADVAAASPVPVSWGSEAALTIQVPTPARDDSATASPLAPLARILQEVSVP